MRELGSGTVLRLTLSTPIWKEDTLSVSANRNRKVWPACAREDGREVGLDGRVSRDRRVAGMGLIDGLQHVARGER